MRKTVCTILILILTVGVFTRCSTEKNKVINRQYHALLTRYNIAFNGQMAYDEGLESIEKSNKDDFSEIIKMYTVSNHENISSASSKMDKTIEKCRKAIKLHSIKKKPKKNYKRIREPKYKAFYYQNEFNPALKKVWILLGKAEFHKGEFLSAVGTFNYITRFYKTNPEMVVEAEIWIARAYLELGWVYEAENRINKINQEKISKKLSGLYSATMAQLFIEKEAYDKAIPFLKIAIENEKKKSQKTRFEFVIAQLFEKTGNNKEATKYYSKVIGRNPPYEMAFNARINRSQITDKPVKRTVRELKRVAKKGKNKEYLDQIYTAIGNVYYKANDTANAVKNYKLAISESTRNGTDKGVALLKLGDYYYNKKEYVKSEPYYKEASTIYTKEYFDFQRINHRALILAELVQENSIVHLQDSLQTLATMPEKERLEAIQKVIDKYIEEEKKKKEKEYEAQYADDDDKFSMPMQPIGRNMNNSWYFYNPTTVSQGKNDFRKKWGRRKLEDNWRRMNKSVAFAENTPNTEEINQQKKESIKNDSLLINNDAKKTQIQETKDKRNVNYYLAQIPFSIEQRETSNSQIADALFNMGFIYKEKIQDSEMAYKTFERFRKRFRKEERAAETIYHSYLIAYKQRDFKMAQKYRNEMMLNYPNDKYADILRNPNYINEKRQFIYQQDSIYSATYDAYTKSKFAIVFKNTKLVKEKYPYATLLPQFEFLNTLSIGKTKEAKEFEKSLNNLVEKYPSTDISAMAKDILALLKQGRVAHKGKTHGSLISKRKELMSTVDGVDINQLSNDKTGQHRLLMLTKANDKEINRLQYNLAIFNFSKFLIKNFGFEKNKIKGKNSLSVTNLSSYQEAIWYHNTLMEDSSLVVLFDALKIRPIAISENNYEKIQSRFTLDDYLVFEKDSLQKGMKEEMLYATFDIPSKQVEEPKKVEIIDKATELFPKEDSVKTVLPIDSLSLKSKKDSLINTVKQEKIEFKNSTIKEKQKVERKPTEKRTKDKVKTKKENKSNEVKKPNAKKVERKPIEKRVKDKVKTKKENKSNEVKKPNVKKVERKQVEKRTKGKVKVKKENKSRKNIKRYKNLFIYRKEAPLLVSLYITQKSGENYSKIEKALGDFNKNNYQIMNLKVEKSESRRKAVVSVGTFNSSAVAKSYLMRMLKDKTVKDATREVNKRNLIITEENLEILLENENALKIYFEFMKKYYLKK